MTSSPARSRRMIDNAASKRLGRSRRLTPRAANCSSPPPIAHCRMKRPRANAARVPTCSATMTGCHRGNRYRAPGVGCGYRPLDQMLGGDARISDGVAAAQRHADLHRHLLARVTVGGDQPPRSLTLRPSSSVLCGHPDIVEPRERRDNPHIVDRADGHDAPYRVYRRPPRPSPKATCPTSPCP